MGLASAKRRWLIPLASFVAFMLLAEIFGVPRDVLDRVPIPGRPQATSPDSAKTGPVAPLVQETAPDPTFKLLWEPRDQHPISNLMVESDKRWRAYEDDRSTTFSETVAKYRRRYGRHPPPGFEKWYAFARERNVHNIDDFDQIMDDLRPFWAIPPKTIRVLAAHMWENEKDGVGGIHIRDGKVAKLNRPSWRPETMQTLISNFVEHLPDMDIAVNVLDQPRVVVPWEDLQKHLKTEEETRTEPPETLNEFTAKMDGILDISLTLEEDNSTREDSQWFGAAGKQYMDIARLGCPPEAHANGGVDQKTAEARWKDPVSGIVTNFNLSSDLCTIGPEIQDKHGLLFTASSITATKRLVPIFGECKVNVNNDILFPANMYWKHDERYDYEGSQDVEWEAKADLLVWRGVTSGGVQLEDNWDRMHRQRLVRLMNSTVMEGQNVSILSEGKDAGRYDLSVFKPSSFLARYTDVGFVEAWGCVPNCDFYNTIFDYKAQLKIGEQFRDKFLVDVDGHSFSGRWRAFLESKALGLKATIFREWHDSRLFAWRHFVPLDNRYDEIFSLLTFFVGVGKEEDRAHGEIYIPNHDLEAKRMALLSREWAEKVLRRDDIEIYMFRLLLEYGRIIDDNRDRIGYSGDGKDIDHQPPDTQPGKNLSTSV